MAVAKITRQGLTSIAILVAILWGCLFAERYLTRTSQMETYRSLRQIRYLRLKRHMEPAAQPAPAPSSFRLGPVVG
jgi:hypothetical protein